MSGVNVGRIEKAFVRSAYSLFQLPLRPLCEYADEKITQAVKQKSRGINWDAQIHASHSDGFHSIEEIFKMARRRGIEFIALTEHNTTKHWDVCKRLEKKYPEVVNVPASEILTRGGDILVYFPNYDCQDLKSVRKIVEEKYLPTKELISLTHRARGIAVAAHPDKNRGIGIRDTIALRDRLDGYEKINVEAGSYIPYIKELSGLVPTGGSDCHALTVGTAYTDIEESCLEGCYVDGVFADKRIATELLLQRFKEEKGRLANGLEPRFKPVRALDSGLVSNIGKMTYANPVSCMFKMVEYGDDDNKVIAKRREACLCDLKL